MKYNEGNVDSGENVVYVFDSLKRYYVNECKAKKIFPSIKAFGIGDIPYQEKVDCGYHMMFYLFIIYYLDGTNHLPQVIPKITPRFKDVN